MIVLRYIPLRLGAEARLDRASSPGRVMDRPDNWPLLTVAFRPITLSHSALNASKKFDLRSTDRPVNHHRDREQGSRPIS